MDAGLLTLIFLIIISGLFSATETSFTALTEAKLRSLEKDKKFASKPILKLKEKPQSLLIAILVSIQTINVIATVVATFWAIRIFGEGNITWVTTVYTIILIFFGSLVPKSLALKFSEFFARIIAYPLWIFFIIVKPIVLVIEFLINSFQKLLKIKDNKNGTEVSTEEIEAVVEMGTEDGALEKGEGALVKRILNFNITSVAKIMTYAKDVIAFQRDIKKDDLMKEIVKSHHYHYPVYGEDLNDIKGFVSMKKIIPALNDKRKKFPLKNLRLQPTVIVPKTISLTELFKELNSQRTRIAIVVNENGQTEGLVTLEDLLKEATITTEERKNGKNSDKNGKKEENIIKKDKNLWSVKGEVTISSLEEELKIEVEAPKNETLNLLVLEQFKRFPKIGEKVIVDKLEIEIENASKKTVDSLLVRKKRK